MLMVNHQQSGFSLVELLVTIGIIGIIVTIALPSYTQFIANTQIRSTAESISNGLQVARAEAIKRNANVSFTLANNTSWIVGCPTVTANCPTLIQQKPAKEGASGTITLTIIGTNTVSFTGLGTTTSTTGQMTQVTVDNSSITAAESKDLRITIGIGGNARVCDPNVSSVTDSRKC